MDRIPITPREQEVLTLIAKGHPNKIIAKELGITTGVVQQHAHHIYQKLNVTNRTEAVYRARQLGLLKEEDNGYMERTPAVLPVL